MADRGIEMVLFVLAAWGWLSWLRLRWELHCLRRLKERSGQLSDEMGKRLKRW